MMSPLLHATQPIGARPPSLRYLLERASFALFQSPSDRGASSKRAIDGAAAYQEWMFQPPSDRDASSKLQIKIIPEYPVTEFNPLQIGARHPMSGSRITLSAMSRQPFFVAARGGACRRRLPLGMPSLSDAPGRAFATAHERIRIDRRNGRCCTLTWAHY
jgi:hypothetical protein